MDEGRSQKGNAYLAIFSFLIASRPIRVTLIEVEARWFELIADGED
jgi:hypothetical protein